MKKQITCIVCPRGCIMTAEGSGDQWEITGNGCKRGTDHAVGECVNPMRMVTSTVGISNREETMVSVKTAEPITKGEMFMVMARSREARVAAPVQIGDVILEDVFGTQIVATGDVK